MSYLYLTENNLYVGITNNQLYVKMVMKQKVYLLKH